jgi:hypothetical protein
VRRDENRDEGGRCGDPGGLAGAQSGPEQPEEGGRRRGVQTPLLRVAQRIADDRPEQGRGIPEDEDGEPGRPEAEPSMVSWAAAARRSPRAPSQVVTCSP